MAIEKQIWIDMLMEGYYPDGSFLKRSVDMTENVEYNKINLAEAGVDPNVLIDTAIYPVPTAPRTDSPLELPLHTFDTENTVVRNIEEKETSYGKMDSVVRSHRNSLRKKTSTFAAHSWAPQSNGQWTPVMGSTGALNPSGVKRVSFEDFLQMEAKFRGLDADMGSLVAVLNPIHLADLMAEDMKLYKEVLTSGKLFSFSLFNFSQLPYFDTTTGAKKAFGSAAGATDTMCSLFYSDLEVMRAEGDVDVFTRYKDPEARGDIVGFQQRFTALPIRKKLQGALYSGK